MSNKRPSRTKRPNMLQIKRGNIWGFDPSDSLQFSNPTPTTKSLHLKFNPRFVVVTEEGTWLFVYWNWTSHLGNIMLFVDPHFFPCVAKMFVGHLTYLTYSIPFCTKICTYLRPCIFRDLNMRTHWNKEQNSFFFQLCFLRHCNHQSLNECDSTDLN